jgi:hygromycin-B 7''-O-kinase
MGLLPVVERREDYVRVYADPDVWRPAVWTIAERHGLEAASLERLTLGTHVVFGAGNRIVKLFCSIWGGDFTSEREALAHITGLPVPELIAEGELEGWPYLVLSTVPGVPALEVWEGLDGAARSDVVRQIGELMRRLHELEPPASLPDDWDRFVAERARGALEHHDAGEAWSGWIERRVAGLVETSPKRVLLHADITEDHVLLSEREGGWTITGLIDFGDARVGHPYYEFVAPLAFYAFGHPELTRELLAGYGLEDDEDTRDRLTTYCLLHEFARVRDFARQLPVDDGPAFERALWGREVGAAAGTE